MSRRRAPAPAGGDRGSTLPLMLGFFLIAGLLLTGGVTASAAFLAQRDLQSACDGAAIAGASGFVRTTSTSTAGMQFDQGLADSAVAQYAQQAWGAEVGQVQLSVTVDGTRVIVQCSRVVHVPFEGIFSPGGLRRTATASADSTVYG